MSVYEGDFADLYDLFYAEKSYDAEVDFTDSLLRTHASGPSHRLLDVACGTGQHAVRFAARGWDVVGVDRSADMLRRAREREGGSTVTFVEQDMTELRPGGEPFDATVCLFDSLGYALTNVAIDATLAGIHRGLRPGGLFVAEFWHAPPMLLTYDPVRVREWSNPQGTIVRISRTELDVVAQTARIAYTVLRLGGDGRYQRWDEVHQNRFFTVPEMDRTLRDSGFEPVSWLSGFDASHPVDDSAWHVVVLARAIDKER